MYYNNFSPLLYPFGYAGHTSEPQCCAPHIPTYTACTNNLWHHHHCSEPSPTIVNIQIPPCPKPEEPKEPLDFSKLAITFNHYGLKSID